MPIAELIVEQQEQTLMAYTSNGRLKFDLVEIRGAMLSAFAVNDLEKEKKETEEILSRVKQACQKKKISLRNFSAQAGIDPGNLSKALSEKKPQR